MRKKGGDGRQGFIRTVGALQKTDPPTYAGSSERCAKPIQTHN